MKNFILFGEMGSGKDTIADILVKEHGYTKLKLGKFIRKHVDELFPNLDENLKRKSLQDYGEGLRVIFGKDVWNDILDQSINSLEGPFVIADGRQIHEFEYWVRLKNYHAIIIDVDEEIKRNRLSLRDGSSLSEEVLTHQTESYISILKQMILKGQLEGAILDNSCNLSNLSDKIRNILLH